MYFFVFIGCLFIICQTIVQHCHTSDLELTATCCVKLRLSLSLSLLSNPDLKLICFLLLSVNYSTYLFRQRLCSHLTALRRCINFVLLFCPYSHQSLALYKPFTYLLFSTTASVNKKLAPRRPTHCFICSARRPWHWAGPVATLKPWIPVNYGHLFDRNYWFFLLLRLCSGSAARPARLVPLSRLNNESNVDTATRWRLGEIASGGQWGGKRAMEERRKRRGMITGKWQATLKFRAATARQRSLRQECQRLSGRGDGRVSYTVGVKVLFAMSCRGDCSFINSFIIFIFIHQQYK